MCNVEKSWGTGLCTRPPMSWRLNNSVRSRRVSVRLLPGSTKVCKSPLSSVLLPQGSVARVKLRLSYTLRFSIFDGNMHHRRSLCRQGLYIHSPLYR